MLLSQSCAAVIYSMLNMAASEPNLATCEPFFAPRWTSCKHNIFASAKGNQAHGAGCTQHSAAHTGGVTHRCVATSLKLHRRTRPCRVKAKLRNIYVSSKALLRGGCCARFCPQTVQSAQQVSAHSECVAVVLKRERHRRGGAVGKCSQVW